MKKQIFGGYSVKETDILLESLRNENKNLSEQLADAQRKLIRLQSDKRDASNTENK